MGEETLFYYISCIRKFVLVTISLFVIYHSVLHLESKRNSCQWLLQRGRLVANQKWQPFGCLLYNYNKTDAKLCLRRSASSNHHVIFIGDTRILQIYHHIIGHIFAKSSYNSIDYNYTLFNPILEHSTRYEDSDLKLVVEFKWHPLPTNNMNTDFEELFSSTKKNKITNSTNRLIIVGQALWPNIEFKKTYSDLLTEYKTNMTRLLAHIKHLKEHDSSTKILWSLQDPVVEKRIQNQMNITNSQVDQFNEITGDLVQTLEITNLNLLSSLRAVTKSLLNEIGEDGIHSKALIIEHKTQILLNYICNRFYAPYDSTCCGLRQDLNLTQFFFILGTLVIILTYVIQFFKLRFKPNNTISTVKFQKVPLYDNTSEDMIDNNRSDEEEDTENINIIDNIQSKGKAYQQMKGDLLLNLVRFSIAILFMFICDRTEFFMKENKFFTLTNFILPIIYVFALGIFFTENLSDFEYEKTGAILNRNQTDEWKGWMQIVVLIYNLTSAENNLRIYMVTRVLLSSYLFLTGFGHFTYFYKTGDISIKRLARTILRLNLLSVCLCLCMNRPYQYYYFVPLVTFWVIIIFLLMKIKPIKNHEYPSATDHFWLVFKISLLIGIVTVFYLSEIFFSQVFLLRPWRFLFITGKDELTIKSWWHHWSVDRYSIIAGVIYGLFHWTIVTPYLKFQIQDTTPRGSACHSRESSQGSQDGLVLKSPVLLLNESFRIRGSALKTIALIGISFYTLFAATCSDKESCDEIHAYVSFVPIVCYIILRNANVFLRNKYSTLFTFIGRISLELSVCQYHIWLAAGQSGLLVLVPSNSTLNLVTTSIIFITTAHKLHSINRKLTHYATNSCD